MNRSVKSATKVCLIIAAFLGIPIAIAANAGPTSEPALAETVAQQPTISCTTEPIAYQTEQVATPDLYIGDSQVATPGQNGERKICTNDSTGTQVSNEITIAPVTQVVHIGQKSRPVVTPTYTSSYRTGAICNDGTHSSATGRGACSWHGGVGEWLYE